jgi:hypothetical protein
MSRNGLSLLRFQTIITPRSSGIGQPIFLCSPDFTDGSKTYVDLSSSYSSGWLQSQVVINNTAYDWCWWALYEPNDGKYAPRVSLQAVQFIPIPPPTADNLEIKKEGGWIVVRWLDVPYSSSAGYTLQSAPTPTGPWSTYTGPVTSTDYVKSAKVSPNSREFYRIKKL